MNRFFSSAWRSAASGFLVVVLSACGGGGGGGGGGGTDNPPAQPPADTANSYLPTDPAIRWTYNDSIETRFEAPTTRNGHVLHSLVYPTGGKEYFVTSAGQISLDGMYLPYIDVGDGTIYTGDIHFDTPLKVFDNGWTSFVGNAVSGKGTIHVSPTYGSQSLQYSGGVNYTATTPIYTKQGIYTAKIVSVGLDMSVTVNGATVRFPYSVNFFFVDGLGIIQRTQGNVDHRLTKVTGLDADDDGVLNAYDKFPGDANRWEVAPLYASDDGIAFASVPSYNRLEQTVTVMQGNGPAPVAWSVSTDQSWLSAVQEPGGRLRIVANPTGLATDTLYEGTVAIHSDSAEVASAPAAVRVGLWVGSQDAPASQSASLSGQRMVADPVRPYLYVNDGSALTIHNVYTGAQVASVGVALNAQAVPAVSSDGRYIYLGVSDGIRRVALSQNYPEPDMLLTTPPFVALAYARPQGHPVLLAETGAIYEADTGKQLVYAEWFDTAANDDMGATASLLGNRVCSMRFVGAQLQCYALSFVDGEYRDVRTKLLGQAGLISPAFDLALSDDGESVYAALGYYGASRFSVRNLGAPTPLATPGNASVALNGPDDIVYVGAGGGAAIGRFDRTGTPTGFFPVVATVPTMAVSGDGAVLITNEAGNAELTRTY